MKRLLYLLLLPFVHFLACTDDIQSPDPNPIVEKGILTGKLHRQALFQDTINGLYTFTVCYDVGGYCCVWSVDDVDKFRDDKDRLYSNTYFVFGIYYTADFDNVWGYLKTKHLSDVHYYRTTFFGEYCYIYIPTATYICTADVYLNKK